MFRRTALLYACILFPGLVEADTLVTWEASGVIQFSSSRLPLVPAIPIGTPFAMTVTFNPNAAVPQFGGGFQPDCLAVPFSGSLTVGSATGSGTGRGFTNAQLPGTTCAFGAPPLGLTQFTFFGGLMGDALRDLLGPAPIIIASYRDLLVQNAFPEVPTGGGALFFNLFERSASGSFTWRVLDVEQPAAVPEPGTLTLFALGAAVLARRVRRQRH